MGDATGMKIEFVNHASVIFEHDNIRLITDPWIFGPAFNNGWRLLSESKFTLKDFENINYIWLSHEHADHFSPRIMKAIPVETRKKLTILFQNTKDHRVAKKCKEWGYKIIEMDKDRFYKIGKDFKIKCNPVPYYDSWLYLEIDGKKILNLNDCVINTVKLAEDIKKKTGKVDILLTQFGYASGIGNEDDTNKRILATVDELQKIKLQMNVFAPKFVIPFASFIRFAHKDNKYMNIDNNKIWDVAEMISHTCTPVILYPGDKWDGVAVVDNKESIDKYLRDMEKPLELIETDTHYTIEELEKFSKEYIKSLKRKNNWILVKHWAKNKQSVIRLADLSLNVSFNLIDGIKLTGKPPNILMDSDSLSFCFLHDYGSDTLHVNGRYRTYYDSDGFFRLFHLGTLTNNGFNIFDLYKKKLVSLIRSKK